MSTRETCRWGILSTAGIARKNWEGILHSGTGRVTAVASRDEGKARAFVAECQRQCPFPEAPRALGSYEALLEGDDVDAVYVPLPTGLRKEWVIRAAEAGKHVLCEKPCAGSTADLKEMVEACRRAGVQFMDGVMYMHSDRLRAMRGVLDDGRSVGTLRRIQSHFSFHASEEFLEGNIRMHSDLEPFGCLGDLGWYTVRISLWAMGYEMPVAVSGRILAAMGRGDSPEPVPMEFAGEMRFASGVTAGFFNSFRTAHQQQVTVSGTEGYLRLADFVLPFFGSEAGFEVVNSEFEVDGCRFQMARRRREEWVAENGNNHGTAQETKLFRTFQGLVLGGEPDLHWPEIALKTQGVMEACLRSARQGGGEVDVKL